jgi:hypothetical protein
MSKLNFAREDFTKKRTEAMTKFKSLRQNFRKREKEIKTDLEKAGRIWKKLGERFKWWQSLP